MTMKKTVTTVILFEDEIRLCAKFLTAWLKANKEDDAAALHDASGNLLRAMMTALVGADDDDAILLLGRKNDMMLCAEKKAKGQP